jgi:hypothetical protein
MAAFDLILTEARCLPVKLAQDGRAMAVKANVIVHRIRFIEQIPFQCWKSWLKQKAPAVWLGAWKKSPAAWPRLLLCG